MTGPTGYVNGKYVPASEVAIPVTDPGFAWGAVVTDRLRTFNGRPFRVGEHLSRFRVSCQLARVHQPRPDDELDRIIRRIVRESWAGADLSIVCLATPDPNLIVYAQPVDGDRVERIRRAGVRLISTAAPPAVDPRIKHRSRLAWWIAAEEVRAVDPHAEPLFIDPAGNVLETPSANVLAVLAETVISPATGTVLPGVSLGVTREVCAVTGIPFAERPLGLAELAGASELLVTNSTYCVAGVSHLDGKPVPFPGPILNRLIDAWSELVGMDLRRSVGR